MKSCQVIQVIRTDLMTRGKGIEGSRIRCIEQYYTPDGELLFEKDPAPETPLCTCYEGPEGPFYPAELPEGCAKRGLPCNRKAVFEFCNLTTEVVYRSCAKHAAIMPIIGADK